MIKYTIIIFIVLFLSSIFYYLKINNYNHENFMKKELKEKENLNLII